MTEQNSPLEMNALLAAAAQPGTEEELAGMSAYVDAFTAEVTAPTIIPIRSHSMFAGRITRRAAAMVAVTMLAAGTAAAAAGGALSIPFTGSDHASESSKSTEQESTDVSNDPSASDDQADGTDAANEAAFGLCQAWSEGADKSADNPPATALEDAAAENDQTVAEYCDDVQATHDANDDDSATEDEDESESESESHDSTHDANDDDSNDDDSSSSITLVSQDDSKTSLPEIKGKDSTSTTDASKSGKSESAG